MGQFRGGHLCPVQKISSTLKRHPKAESITVAWRARALKSSYEFEDTYDRRRGTLESRATIHDLRGNEPVIRAGYTLAAFTNVTDEAIHAAGQKGLAGQPLVKFLTHLGCKHIKPNAATGAR